MIPMEGSDATKRPQAMIPIDDGTKAPETPIPINKGARSVDTDRRKRCNKEAASDDPNR